MRHFGHDRGQGDGALALAAFLTQVLSTARRQSKCCQQAGSCLEFHTHHPSTLLSFVSHPGHAWQKNVLWESNHRAVG